MVPEETSIISTYSFSEAHLWHGFKPSEVLRRAQSISGMWIGGHSTLLFLFCVYDSDPAWLPTDRTDPTFFLQS